MSEESKGKTLVEEFLNENKQAANQEIVLSNNTAQAEFLAPLGKRVLAYTVDRILLFFLYTSIGLVFFRIFGSLGRFIVPLLIDFVFAGFFYSRYAATPGKMLFSLRVHDEKGQKLSFAKGGARDALGKALSVLFFGIGYLFAFFREDRKALHDLLFKTKVIYKKD